MSYAFDLACSVLAAAVWYVRPEWGPWPLLLIVAGRLARLLAGRRAAFRLTPFDAPALLFLASAWLGLRVAYDGTVAAAKFWQIVGGLALYDSVARSPEQVRVGKWQIAPVRVLLAALPTVLASYFMLTNDWLHWLGKLPWLDSTARWLAIHLPHLPGHQLHPNVAGGLIAGFIPLQIAALATRQAGCRHSLRSLRLGLAVVLVGASLVALLLTASRGAWIAVAAACLIWWLLPRIVPARRDDPAAAPAAAVAKGTVLQGSLIPLAVLAGLLLVVPAALGDRLNLLHNSLNLALDYPFTGLGLGGFEMAFSSYVLLLHVGHTVHSHNLFLNVWLEQGLPGLIALAWFLVLAALTAWRSLRSGRATRNSGAANLALAALATLLVILFHGMVDDAFYGSRAVLLLFIPFGVLAQEHLALQDQLRLRKAEGSTLNVERSTFHVPKPLRWLIVIAALATLLLLPGIRAAFQANLGALDQTRSELALYRWPAWPIQDALRRSPQVDLQPAMARYRAALALNPDNVTANRRLGQIALSVGQYDAAQQYLARAYQAAPDQRATRQMLGECYAMNGEQARAISLWNSIDMSEGQLTYRQWWYERVGDKQAAQRIAAAAAKLAK
jgi:tetratricopeptide (TPR) repeat protein